MKRIPFLKIDTKNGPTYTKKYFQRLQNERLKFFTWVKNGRKGFTWTVCESAIGRNKLDGPKD